MNIFVLANDALEEEEEGSSQHQSTSESTTALFVNFSTRSTTVSLTKTIVRSRDNEIGPRTSNNVTTLKRQPASLR